jgi:hypothetical protein
MIVGVEAAASVGVSTAHLALGWAVRHVHHPKHLDAAGA